MYLYIHLENHNYLEAILVKGDIMRIRKLAKQLIENRGIETKGELYVIGVKLVWSFHIIWPNRDVNGKENGKT
jgi:hypothetical protein